VKESLVDVKPRAGKESGKDCLFAVLSWNIPFPLPIPLPLALVETGQLPALLPGLHPALSSCRMQWLS
jgi:hypothetical protein